jgi:hypothetical protein
LREVQWFTASWSEEIVSVGRGGTKKFSMTLKALAIDGNVACGRDEICSSSMFLDLPRSAMSLGEGFVSGGRGETKKSSLALRASMMDEKAA